LANDEPVTGSEPVTLRRSLGIWLLVFYGLGIIIGAGIYVLVGEVAARAGMAAPLAFVVAGVMAALTGLCYAELCARHPEAAGSAAYVKEAFGSDALSRLVGLAVAGVGIIASASLARGSAGYLAQFITLPEPVGAGVLVVLFTAIACLGVTGSVTSAAVLTGVEIFGLVLVISAGAPALSGIGAHGAELVPVAASAWTGIGAGAFLAFFAFLGFENLANMAEETRDVGRTLPRAILITIGVAGALYGLVALVVVLAVPLDRLIASRAPLALVMEGVDWATPEALSAIALVAVANGVLIETVMLGRLLYGMSRRGWLPGALAEVNPLTRTPVRTTLLAGVVIFALAVTVPFVHLVVATSTITLLVFLAVDLALMRLHRVRARADLKIRVPRLIPYLAALSCLVLLAVQFLG
jgi:amino acid transporter